ncbi:hypothetical protein SE17_30015, partial [Kouleothrix aurantiaca]
RAAFYLFQSKTGGSPDWQAAYRAEVRERPVPGAPLPPAVFEGGKLAGVAQSSYGASAEGGQGKAGPNQHALPEVAGLAGVAVGLVVFLLVFLVSRSWLIALLAGVAGLVVMALQLRNRRR